MTDTLTKREPKLSVRKPGYWRNKVRIGVSFMASDGVTFYRAGEQLCDRVYPSRELAEAYAENWFRTQLAPGNPYRITYLGPVFFPEGDDQ